MTRLHHDLACTACGYNIRGLTIDQPCPECGQTVRTSIEAWTEQFESTYVTSAQSCATAVAWTPLAWVGFGILCVLISIAINDPRPMALVAILALPMSLFYWAAGYGFVSMARAMEGRGRVAVGYLIASAAMPVIFLVAAMGFGAEGAAANTIGLAAVQIPVWVMWRATSLTRRFGGSHLIQTCVVVSWIVTMITLIVFGTIVAMVYVYVTAGAGVSDWFSSIVTIAVNFPLGIITLSVSCIAMTRVRSWLRRTSQHIDIQDDLRSLLEHASDETS